MSTATQKQKDAFADLLTAACYTNPVSSDIAPVRIAQVDDLVHKIYTMTLVPDATAQERANVVLSLGVFGSLYQTYQRLENWTAKYFVSSNPPYQQQHIGSLLGTALAVDTVLTALGNRPHWDNPGVFNPMCPDDVPPLSLSGNKYNSTWADDLIGSVKGSLVPTFSNISTVQSSLANNLEFVAYLDALTLALANIVAAEAPYPDPNDDPLTDPPPEMITPEISIQDVVVILGISGVGTTYAAIDPQLISNLTNYDTLINNQVNREQWWWHPLTDDQYFSQYSRASQVAVSGGTALAIAGMASSPALNDVINRTASPAMILAKDEIPTV